MNTRHTLLILGAFTMTALMRSSHGIAAPLVIANDTLEVRYEPGDGLCSIGVPGAATVIGSCGFAASGGTAKVVAVVDEAFGKGQCIEIAMPDGTKNKISVFPRLPFALFRSQMRNSGKENITLNETPRVRCSINLGVPADTLRTLGTGGLKPPNSTRGSYAWLAVADPQTRRGVVAGWLSYDKASGIVAPKVAGGNVNIEAWGEFGRLRLKPSQVIDTETLAIGSFDDARLGLEAWAAAVAAVYRIKLPPQPNGYCTWYSDKHGKAGDEKSLAELAAFAARELKPFGFDFVQIDDCWQQGSSQKNGPNKNFTAHRGNGPYRAGMKPIADKIKQLGLTPGIWFMPFAGTYNDPWFKDHQDWFAKFEDGKPFDTRWGGTSMDMTNPGAREYLRGIVQRIAREWGYTYFKMDGLYTGIAGLMTYPDPEYVPLSLNASVLFNPDKSNVEAYRDGLKLVRETAGSNVFLLGCCAEQNMHSYANAFGLLDAMRIGPDNGGSWEGWSGRSPVFGTRHYFLHGRIWYNDPDPVFLRSKITLTEVRTMCSWTAIAGQLNVNSDWLPDVSADRLDAFKRTMPAHTACARPVDLFEDDVPRIWTVTDQRDGLRRDVVALFNWDDKEQSFACPLDSLGLDAKKEYALFDFWTNALIPSVKEKITLKVAGHGCAILAARPIIDRPQVLSTSRHVTQGIVDLRNERWDAQKGELSGTSSVVAGDAYELRILARSTKGTWKLAGAPQADMTIGPEEPGLVRVTIKSAISRDVSWKLRFVQP